MSWVPKSSAPATFNLPDALLALITGDATWGWLVDWLPFITNDQFSTADFCAFGPITPPDLSVALGPSPPDRNPIAFVAKWATIGAALTLAARDRVFQAYCEQPDVLVGGWGTPVCYDIHDNADLRSGAFDLGHVPAAAAHARQVSWTETPPNYGANELWLGDFPLATGSSTWTYHRTIWGWEIFDATPFAVTAGSILHAYANNGATGTLCLQYDAVFDPTPYAATPQAQPAGVLSPLLTVDPSLEGIAHELELLELKSDTMLSIIQGIAGATLDLGGPLADPLDLVADTPLAVGDAVGAVITASGVPDSRSLDFGTPQNIVRLGHINCGTATAWYPSIWLTHTPFMVRPFPPGTTQVTVTDLPPGCTCSIQFIARNK